jgi:uncharacterized protein YndB with AHSA1/START domain
LTDATDSSDASSFTYRRVHWAPPDLLFDCMTQPEHLTHFWGPTGTTAPEDRIIVDLRPGGVFETAMVNDADGSEYVMHAVYLEIERPSHLAWVEPDSGMRTRVTFVDLGDGRTEVITQQTNVPEAYRSPGAQEGFVTSLDRYRGYVAALFGEELR